MQECVSFLFLSLSLKYKKASIEHFALFQYCSFNKLKTSFHERRF